MKWHTRRETKYKATRNEDCRSRNLAQVLVLN